MAIFYSCASEKYVRPNERMLIESKITGAPKEHSEALNTLYIQKPNRKVLNRAPYVSLYNIGKLRHDTTKLGRSRDTLIKQYQIKAADTTLSKRKQGKIKKKYESKIKKINSKITDGNFLMSSLGEAPVIFDTAKARESTDQMHQYLFTKGFYLNKVTYDTTQVGNRDVRKRRVRIDYRIDPGKVYTIASYQRDIPDARMEGLLENSSKDNYITLNEPYNEEHINEERERIYRLMKDSGYYDFTRQYIFFEADTNLSDYKVNLTLTIKNPQNQTHKYYKISRLFFNNQTAERDRLHLRDTLYDRGVYYTYLQRNFSLKLLDSKIKLRKGQYYCQNEIQHTQRLLGSMDIYKFVNINFEKDKKDTSGHTVTGYINTQPLPKYQLSQEYGMSVGQALVPGPFISLNFKNRNVFKGFELFETNARFSIDGQAGVLNNSEVYKTQEFGLNSSITFPQIFFPTKLRYKFNDYAPRTKVLIGYNYVRRPEYRRENFKGALQYLFDRNQHSHFFITPFDVNIIGSEIKDQAFSDFLDELRNKGSNLYLSFYPSVVTSFHINYLFNNNEVGKNKISKFFRPSLEIGGLAPRLASALIEDKASAAQNQLFNKQFFEFYRFSMDLRYYFPIRKVNTLALRLNTGFAHPFGRSNSSNLFVLPYEKYFFTGGSNSIRAWKPRRLGPGSYRDSTGQYLFEQPGEILLESSIEYRFKMIKYLDGALFADAGNVWSIKDGTRPGSEFKYLKSIPEIAVGAGFGLRLNFTFLIIRFDLAQRIWDPGQPDGSRFVGHLGFRDTALNLGIGYPF